MKQRARLLAAVVALLTAAPAHAFKEPGHRAIEVAAYQELLRRARPDGSSVLTVLIDHGVLKPPSSPRPQPSEVLDSGYEMLLVESMRVETHLPDHLMDRQLQADRQCFHFNARGAHFTLSDEKYWGRVPKGLVVDAYVECIGVADGLLRGILFDPAASREEHADIYSLIHMIEDSYSDAHVARSGPVGTELGDGNRRHGEILFVKPWNLRTWLRYFVLSPYQDPVREHFADSHHMGSDTRDLGYLVGPTDEDYTELVTDERTRVNYRARVERCLVDARRFIRPRAKADRDAELRIEDLYGEVVPPESCLSDRALAAKSAVVALLELVATYVPLVRTAPGVIPSGAGQPSVRHVLRAGDGKSFEDAWREYRRKYLLHRIPELTDTMDTADWVRPIAPGELGERERSPRRDRVFSAKDLSPREFNDAGFGLGVEVRGSTPLWLGLDAFVTRKGSSHNRTVVLLDTLGWGFQLRLPLENEMGERPVGAAFDIGPGLPLPVSELVGVEELQLFVGARARIAYTAQAIFERETRHAMEFGVGGLSVDATFGHAWLGLDLLRKMYYVDFWDPNATGWSPLTFGVAGGVALDAF